jgi:hypothetical protein
MRDDDTGPLVLQRAIPVVGVQAERDAKVAQIAQRVHAALGPDAAPLRFLWRANRSRPAAESIAEWFDCAGRLQVVTPEVGDRRLNRGGA